MSIAKRRGLPSVLMLCLLSQSGCITLNSLIGESKPQPFDTRFLETQGYSIPPGGMPSPVKSDPHGAPRVILEVRDGERHLESIPLSAERAMFIEDVVQQAQLHDRFGQLMISIMRPDGHGGPPVRLELQTDNDGKAVKVGHNYALMPGDHIVVNPDNRSSIEKMLDSLRKR